MINERVFGTPITGSVRDELSRRQDGTKDFEFGESIKLQKNIELSSRTPFIRMWTAIKLTEPERIIAKLIDDGVAEEIDESQIKTEQDNQSDVLKNYNQNIENLVSQIPDMSEPTSPTYVNISTQIQSIELAKTFKTRLLKFLKKPKTIKETIRETTYEEKIYVLGNYEYENNYRQISPNEPNNSSNFFQTEGVNNKLLKPQSGITSVTSETQEGLGLIKKTTVNFVVHNFYDFDKIYNKYFLKPGAKIFLDFGWNVVENLYEPKKLLEKAKSNELQKFLYSEGGIDDVDYLGEITKNNGNLEILSGIVSDYNAKILSNGSVECSVTLTSSNNALLSFENDDETYVRISKMLESGIFYLGLQQIINNLPEDSQDRKDLEEDSVPNYTTSTEDIKIYENNLRKNASRSLGFQSGQESVTNLSVVMGLFLIDSNLSDAYMSWGRFEDYIINETFGHGKDANDINEGDSGQIRMDSSNEFSMWSSRFEQRQRALLRIGKEVPNFIFPSWWGNNSPSGRNPSYTFQKGKYPKDSIGTIEDKGSDEFGRIPLREVFINIKFIKDTFEEHKNKPIKNVVKILLDKINKDSDNLFKWKLTAGNTESQLKIIDMNYTQREKLKVNENSAGTNNLFTFKIMSPDSIVKDYNLEFKLPSNSIGDMYAIKGMSALDKISKSDPRIQNLVDLETIDFDNLNTIYLPDDGSFRAQDKLNKDSDAESYRVYNRINDLLSTDTMNISVAVEPKYDFIQGSMYAESNSDETTGGEKPKKVKQKVDLYKISDQSLKVSGFIVTNSVIDYYRSKSIQSIKNNNSDLLPYTLSLSIYGISSIVPGDTFKVDYLPKEHLENTFLQVVKVSHDISSAGWTTSLDTQYRPFFPENKNSIFLDIPANKGKVRLSASCISDEFKLMAQDRRIAPDIDPGFFESIKVSGDRDTPIDYKYFFKFTTDFVIEDQTEDSKIDHILHFKTRLDFDTYLDGNKIIDGRIQNHRGLGFKCIFKGKNINNTIGSDFKVETRGANKTSKLDDDKIDLVYNYYGNPQNTYVYPPNIRMKADKEYRLFIKDNTAVILDPKIDGEGNTSEQYKKLKSFFQKYLFSPGTSASLYEGVDLIENQQNTE